MLPEFVQFIRTYYRRPEGAIALHESLISAEDQEAVQNCLASAVISSVGPLVDAFEGEVAEMMDVKFAIATNSGTAALHLALLTAGVQAGDLVITQPFSFVATVNAICYLGASPLFLDIAQANLGLSPAQLQQFLEEETTIGKKGKLYHQASGRRIAACLPVYSFGHPPAMDRIARLCQRYNIPLVEDAAEALGSTFKGKPPGQLSTAAILSFNGNKIISSGGGGMLLTNDEDVARRARHLSEQARTFSGQQVAYDAVGFNYRMPNLNAALGLSQLKSLDTRKAALQLQHQAYHDFFSAYGYQLIQQPEGAASNYWLHAVSFENQQERDAFVNYCQHHGVLVRPAWPLLSDMPMYRDCQRGALGQARLASEHLALLPASFKIHH
jgi:aminotransferase in exopolysaccharide biosynthesis